MKSQFKTKSEWMIYYDNEKTLCFCCSFKPTETELRRLCIEEWWQYDGVSEETIDDYMKNISVESTKTYYRKIKK